MSYPNDTYYQQQSGDFGYTSGTGYYQEQTYSYDDESAMLQTQYPSLAATQYSYTTPDCSSYIPRSGASSMSYSLSTSSYASLDTDAQSPSTGYPGRDYYTSTIGYDLDDDALSSPTSTFSPYTSTYDGTECTSPLSAPSPQQYRTSSLSSSSSILKNHSSSSNSTSDPASSRERPYFCLVRGCTTTTARAACMERHVKNVHFKQHAEREDCPEARCDRVGARGFTRRDKLYEHLREVHHVDLPKKGRRRMSSRTGMGEDGALEAVREGEFAEGY